MNRSPSTLVLKLLALACALSFTACARAQALLPISAIKQCTLAYASITLAVNKDASNEDLIAYSKLAYELCAKEKGEKDEITRTAAVLVSKFLLEDDLFEQAKSFINKVLPIEIQVSGETSKFSLSLRASLLHAIYSSDGSKKALPLIPALIKDFDASSDLKDKPLHYSLLDTASEALAQEERVAEAAPLFRQRLALAKKLFGNEHTETLNAMTSAAYNAHVNKDYQESIDILQQKLAIENKLFLETDQRLKHSNSNMVGSLIAAKRWGDAKKYFDSLYARKDIAHYMRLPRLLEHGLAIYNALDDKAKVKELSDRKAAYENAPKADKKLATEAFDAYQKLLNSYDAKGIDAYSDTAEILVLDSKANGERKKIEFTGKQLKELGAALMAESKRLGEQTKFNIDDVKLSGSYAEISYSHTSKIGCYTDNGAVTMMVQNDKQYKVVATWDNTQSDRKCK